MKVLRLALFSATAISSVSAQEGKKGGMDMSPGMGGKKGMSMMSMPLPTTPSVTQCNSGRVSCDVFLAGCSEFVRNEENGDSGNFPITYDSNSCLEFCAENMNATSYYVEFALDPSRAEDNECVCYEACQEFDDISMDADDFAVLFAVGDNDCSYFPTTDADTEDQCTDTPLTTCADGDDTEFACTGAMQGGTTGIATAQACLDFCWGFNLPIASLALDGDRECNCFLTSDLCAAQAASNSVIVVEATTGMCPTLPTRR